MPTSEDILPKGISNDAINKLLESIGLPNARKITAPRVDAKFHAIYMIGLPHHRNDRFRHISTNELVLRVAANYWPRIKSENEHGVMNCVRSRTSIPVPEVIGFDHSDKNPLGYEYSLLARVPGETLSDIWQELDDKQMNGILDQLANILAELHSIDVEEIGGVVPEIGQDDNWQMGRVIDETFWANPQITLWPSGETIDSLNIGGPFETYSDYISAQISLYIRQIRLHPNLKFFRRQTYALEAFLASLREHAEELNKTMLILAHKDLHFGNIMYDRDSGKITGILDWEFSGVVPAPKWNPRKAFLWNCDDSENGKTAKALLEERFAQRYNSMFPKQVQYTSPRQKAMQEIADHVRAIIEVKVLDQRYSRTTQMQAQLDERVREWEKTISKALEVFGIY
ncbi:kinase-like domain-containing protein [Annulohypoxylon moriforme]|nr:kinase-like domain-containing protein [Annulohypoxylon moriforme]